MSFRIVPSFAARLSGANRPLAGIWACSGSALVTEICAGSGLDWMLIDMEHSPNGLEAVLSQLQVAAAYPITTMVRVPVGERTIIKQVLDLGAQNILVPMVNSAQEARELVQAMHYPPRGVRGVGSALARSARWNRVDDYLNHAADTVSLFVQVETVEAVNNLAEIVAVEGVDGIFLGPSDLAASMGYLGKQTHPEVTAAVMSALSSVQRAGKPAGVNAFDRDLAQQYVDAGASFVLVGADVALLARASESLADYWVTSGDDEPRSSY